MSESGPLPEDVSGVQSALVEWYETDHRSFPWRETTDPYRILVSEVMSQQTQLSRVEEAYHDFLEEWPDVETLAATDQSDVVGFWSRHSPSRSVMSTTAPFPTRPTSYRS